MAASAVVTVRRLCAVMLLHRVLAGIHGELGFTLDVAACSRDADIALLVLDSPSSRTTMPLDTGDSDHCFDNRTQVCPLKILGWDIYKHKFDFLQEVVIDSVGREKCDNIYGGVDTNLTDSMICAGNFIRFLGSVLGFCSPEPGAPLITVLGDQRQVGIASFLTDCQQGYYPGVYTSVSKFRSWIDSKIKEVDYLTSVFGNTSTGWESMDVVPIGESDLLELELDLESG